VILMRVSTGSVTDDDVKSLRIYCSGLLCDIHEGHAGTQIMFSRACVHHLCDSNES